MDGKRISESQVPQGEVCFFCENRPTGVDYFEHRACNLTHSVYHYVCLPCNDRQEAAMEERR